jgi:transcription initiation factor IIF auxiliary subunit
VVVFELLQQRVQGSRSLLESFTIKDLSSPATLTCDLPCMVLFKCNPDKYFLLLAAGVAGSGNRPRLCPPSCWCSCVLVRLELYVVQIENHPNDDDGEVLIPVAEARGAITRDLVSAAPLESLRDHFPAWDGEVDQLLDSAYTKFKIPDPRALKSMLKGLSPSERLEHLPLPKGAVPPALPSELAAVDSLLVMGASMHARTQARIARPTLPRSTDKSSSSDDEPSQPRPKALFDTPIEQVGKRKRARPPAFRAGPASSKPTSKQGSATTKRGSRVTPPRVPPSELTPTKLKMTKEIQAGKAEREKDKVRSKQLEQDLASSRAQVCSLQVQQGAEFTVNELKVKLDKLQLLCFSMKAIAMAHAQNAEVMGQALERVAKNFGVNLED